MGIRSGLTALVGAILFAAVLIMAHDLWSPRRPPEQAASVAPGAQDIATGPIAPVGALSAAARRRLPSAAPPEAGRPTLLAPAQAAAEPGPGADERDRQMATMRDSGSDSDDLAGATNRIRLSLDKIVKESRIPGSVAPWECYRAGCFATVVERSGPSVEELTTEVLASEDVARWPGRSTRSATIPRTDGTFESTWFFYAGGDAGPAPRAASAER